MNTPEGVRKARETLIAKHGSYEAYLEYMRGLASKGGKRSTGAFLTVDGLASRAGKKSRKKT